MQKMIFGILFLFVGMVSLAQDNPFVAGSDVWAVETVNGTHVSSLMFAPIFSGSMGNVFIFPDDWESDDSMFMADYFWEYGGGNFISFATSEKDITTYRYEFLEEDHFVLYYPLDHLNPSGVEEVIYRATLEPDE